MDTMLKCACGCGEYMSLIGKNGKKRRFLKGHATRNRSFKDPGSELWWEKRLIKLNSSPEQCNCGCGELIYVTMGWLKEESGPSGKSVWKPKFLEGHIPQIECACGCGTLIDKYGKRNRLMKCVPSHGGTLAVVPTISEEEWIRRTDNYNSNALYCECGCGERLTASPEQMKGRKKVYYKSRYINGHNTRNFIVNSLTPEEKSLIYGSLLGDMSINIPTTGNPRLAFNHGKPQKEYAIHKTVKLQRLGAKFKIIDNPGYGDVSIRMVTSCMPVLMEVWNKVRPNDKKEVNEEWLKEVDEVALAYWFMDDGSVNRTKSGALLNACIHTCGFGIPENELLVTFLKERFGLEPILAFNRGYPYLRFNVKSTRVLGEIITPHLHPSMAYKGNCFGSTDEQI